MTKRKKWTAAAVSMSAMLVLTSACSGSKGGNPSSSPSSSAAVEAITDPSKQPEITLRCILEPGQLMTGINRVGLQS